MTTQELDNLLADFEARCAAVLQPVKDAYLPLLADEPINVMDLRGGKVAREYDEALGHAIDNDPECQRLLAAIRGEYE